MLVFWKSGSEGAVNSENVIIIIFLMLIFGYICLLHVEFLYYYLLISEILYPCFIYVLLFYVVSFKRSRVYYRALYKYCILLLLLHKK